METFSQLTKLDYASLSPLLVLVAAALLPLLFESYFRKQSQVLSAIVAFVGIITAIWLTLTSPASTNPLLTKWIQFDATQQSFSLLFLGIGLASIILSYAFLKNRDEESEGEYYFLLIASLFGLILMAMSADFLTLFLGLETLSLALYVMCAYLKKWHLSQEAALKYFFLGALSSAFLLFGIALIYGATGTTNFAALLPAYQTLTGNPQLLFLAGVGMVTLALCFKAAIVPFHSWAPDVYEGASTPVAAFMSVGTKAGAFVAFIRIFIEALPQFNWVWYELVALLAIPTLIYANWVALKQTQLRRFFAYSGISHAGYLLIAVAAGTQEASQAILSYLVIYGLATFAVFGVILVLEKKHEEGLQISDLRGLFQKAPLLAGVMALGLLTLAGIPPTAGFVAKLNLFKTAWAQGFHVSVCVALATAILGAYYYTRIIVTLFMEQAKEEAPAEKDLYPAGIVAIACFLLIIWISFYPAPLFSMFSN